MNKNVYFKMNEEKAEVVEQYLIDNNIEYTRYSNALKALCDEEVERMREEYLQIELTEEQAEQLSETIFNTEMDLLNYDTFLELTDRFVESVESEE